MISIWDAMPSEADRFDKWWSEYAATLHSKPTALWRAIALAAWLAAREM